MNIKKYKICRRLGASVFEQCTEPTREQSGGRRRTGGRRRQLSEFGQQMLDKQRVRYTYGLRERQFRNYINEASSRTDANPAEHLYRTLESRLDNVIYRLGFAPTRSAARQVVSHGHITINGRKIDIPSYHVKPGDVVAIKETSRDKGVFAELSARLEDHTPPVWLKRDDKQYTGTVDAAPTMDDYAGAAFNLTAVLEFYSR